MTDELLAERRIAENIKFVNDRIATACFNAGRGVDEVDLMAVTKTVDPKWIDMAINCGVKYIGENRVQEFFEKKDHINLASTKVHLIGSLQTNKVNQVVGNVSCIQSVDRIKLARRISDASAKIGVVTEVLVQVKMGEEDTKAGFLPDELLPLLYEISQLKGISVQGLMTIPPIFDAESEKRAVFSQMYKLFVDIRGKNIDNIYMNILSMGMSGDFFEAVLEGATLVRVGASIFGQRT